MSTHSSERAGEKSAVREAAARAVAALYEHNPDPDWTDPDDEDAAWFFAVVDAVLAHLDGRTWEIAQTLHNDNDRLRAMLQGVHQDGMHLADGGVLIRDETYALVGSTLGLTPHPGRTEQGEPT